MPRSHALSLSEKVARVIPWWKEFTPLLLIALISGGVWAFSEIADEVMEGETHEVDEWIMLAMRNPADPSDPLGPAWFEEMARDLTALGGMAVLCVITAAVCGFLLLDRKPAAALLAAAAIGSGLLVASALKYGFSRERPDLVPHGSYVYTSSFPSGHSMLAAVTYLTLAALLMRVQPRLRLKAYTLVLAVLLTLGIGASRVYLGVHWPSDVLGGWAAGATWALLWWFIVWRLQRRGTVEKARVVSGGAVR
jgi:undecaprenyl-diphosphatase